MNKLSFDKSRIRFLFLEGIHENVKNLLLKHGYTNFEFLDESLGEVELINKIKGVHFLGIRSRTQVTSQVLESANRLVSIGCFCIGTNQVDLVGAALKGVPVFNAPYSNTRSVAELVLAEAILLLRGIPEKNSLMHAGFWQKNAKNSHEIRGKILGVIGYGRIGSQLSVLAESFGMSVIFYDITTKLSLGNAKQVNSLSDLLAQADIVTLHVPDTLQTNRMIGVSEFTQMKRSSIFINAARGNCVDIEALAKSLKMGHVQGAAIDVFPVEPSQNGKLFTSPLQEYPNVILTPHIGGSTIEAQANIGLEVAIKLVECSDSGSTFGAVNFPEIALSRAMNKFRLLHIHYNLPGVLASVNEIFARAGINISSQQLMTLGEVGYMVIDIDKSCDALVLQKLRNLKETIKVRVLN